MESNELVLEWERVYRETMENEPGDDADRKEAALEAACEVIPDSKRLLAFAARAIMSGRTVAQMSGPEADGYALMSIMRQTVVSVLGRKDTRDTYVVRDTKGVPTVFHSMGDESTEEKEKFKSMGKLYREWVAEHMWVPTDQVLAHFSGYSLGRFSAERSKMTAEGWLFEKANNVWRVKSFPKKEKFSSDEVREIVEDVIAQLRKRR